MARKMFVVAVGQIDFYATELEAIAEAKRRSDNCKKVSSDPVYVLKMLGSAAQPFNTAVYVAERQDF